MVGLFKRVKHRKFENLTGFSVELNNSDLLKIVCNNYKRYTVTAKAVRFLLTNLYDWQLRDMLSSGVGRKNAYS